MASKEEGKKVVESQGNQGGQGGESSDSRERKIALLIIDPQVDFHEGGSLPVAGATKDSHKISSIIETFGSQISSIHVTLDSHQRMHIANSLFWVSEDGKHPDPFTIITKQDVERGKWKPSRSDCAKHALEYVDKLEKNKRFVLCIWPDHCIIGTPGHCIERRLNEALEKWARKKHDVISYVFKGTNSLTEMYSAIKADVEIADDPSTKVNQAMLDALSSGVDDVVICGEALSHCVNFTTRDLVAAWNAQPPKRRPRVVVLRDAASPVGGFERAAEDFLQDIAKEGAIVTTTAEYFGHFPACDCSFCKTK